jgi:thioredoxin 1
MKKTLLLILIAFCTLVLFAKEEAKPAPKKKPLVTFLELGAETCVPCKMMKPVMKDIQDEYKDKIDVIFHDITKDREIAKKYNVRVMPTQIFLDKDGKEFHRHEGFYPKDEIIKIVDQHLGIKRSEKK